MDQHINSVENEYQLQFTNFRYVIRFLGEAVGVFFCGLMYELGLKYMFGLSAFFMIFQLATAYGLIYMRQHGYENKREDDNYINKMKKIMTINETKEYSEKN